MVTAMLKRSTDDTSQLHVTRQRRTPRPEFMRYPDNHDIRNACATGSVCSYISLGCEAGCHCQCSRLRAKSGLRSDLAYYTV